MFVFGRVKIINIKPIHPGIYMDLPSWKGGRSLENMHGIVNNQLSPPIHDMDVRKWNLELNKVWIEIGTSLTHLYVPKNLHITVFLVGHFVPWNPANQHLLVGAWPANDLYQRTPLLQDFASWRKEQIEEQLPDPEDQGVGLSMYLVSCPKKLEMTKWWIGTLRARTAVGWQPTGVEEREGTVTLRATLTTYKGWGGRDLHFES